MVKCEYCHKRKATKQRASGLLVCEQCNKELEIESERYRAFLVK